MSNIVGFIFVTALCTLPFNFALEYFLRKIDKYQQRIGAGTAQSV
jgi:hypothetical protein